MRAEKISRIAAIVLVLSFMTTVLSFDKSCSAEETITFAFWEEPSQHPAWRSAELVYTEAFRRLGMKFRYEIYPAKRASMMINTGQVDGEPARYCWYGNKFPNVIRVEEPLIADPIQVYATNPNISCKNWESLRNQKYRVDYRRGSLIMEQNLTSLVRAEDLFAINEPIQGLRKLVAGHTDIFIDNNISILPLLAAPEFVNSGIREVCQLQKIFLYAYLHKRHAALASNLTDTLRQMKREGLFDHYQQQAQQEFSRKSITPNAYQK